MESEDKLDLGNLLKEEFEFSVRTFFAPVIGIAHEVRRQFNDTRNATAAAPEDTRTGERRS